MKENSFKLNVKMSKTNIITKKELTEYLINKGVYQEIDRYLIDEFIQYIKMAKDARDEIAKYGSVLNVSRDADRPYYQQHPAVSILNQCTKNLLNISRKLALSPYDRANLKIEIDNEEDENF